MYRGKRWPAATLYTFALWGLLLALVGCGPGRPAPAAETRAATDQPAAGGEEEPTARDTSDIEPRTVRLGAWNIKKLGHGSSKRYDLVAQVIEEHFDLVAILEVMQKGGTHPGYDELLGQAQETMTPRASCGTMKGNCDVCG